MTRYVVTWNSPIGTYYSAFKSKEEAEHFKSSVQKDVHGRPNGYSASIKEVPEPNPNELQKHLGKGVCKGTDLKPTLDMLRRKGFTSEEFAVYGMQHIPHK